MQPSFRPSLFLCAFLLSAIAATAQTASVSPSKAIDESRRVTLHGTVHPLAQAQYDRGAVQDSFPAERMLLMLNRSAEREAALQKFLRDVHVQGSPSYHRWVTPEEFGSRFGAADEDIAAVRGWLQSHGLSVPRVAKNRTLIEFSGTAAQVREALHAEIHQYVTNGETHYSVANEVSIPEDLAPLIRGFAPLNNFELTSYVHTVGSATYSRNTRRATPLFTTTLNNQAFYAVAPEDFGTQYDLPPVYNAGIDGTGQTIGILGGSNIDLSLVDAHRKLFGLPASNVQVVIDGEDPGPTSSNVEGFLDVEVSGAVAPKAAVNFYIAGGTHFQGFVTLAAVRAVEDNQASVLSASFGECEQLLGESGNQFWSALWEQAAAQGQTVFVSSGDTGPATCPLVAVGTPPSLQIVSLGLSVNGLSSTPWNVSVGGTDFFYSDYASGPSSVAARWNATNDSSFGSLKNPLQEQVWDDVFGLNVIPFSPLNGFSIPSVAGGGGPSSCSQSTDTPPALPVCVAGHPKPVWQNAPGVPSDGVRDLPDLSLFAANGKNLSAYPICANPGDCAPVASGDPQVFLVGGTSASSPAMAGIMALVNQKFGRQGQANFTFYALARQQLSVFRDVSVGTNDVLCEAGLLDCNTPVPSITFAGSYGVYAAGPGYDLASGLGSLDAGVLLNSWNQITFLPTATTLQLSPLTVVHGAPVSVTTTVSPTSPPSGGSGPTGDVDLAIAAAVPLPKSGALPLASGSANASINFFPGGTYQVTAQYAGDGVYGGSSSSPVTLTVTPEPSSTSLDLRYRYVDWSATPIVGHSGTVPVGGQVPASSQWTFEAQPSGLSSQTTGQATGTATFTDGANSVQVPLNSSGIATWSPQGLSIGGHSVSVNYSGDPSYNGSVAGPLTFTVTKGIPRLIASPIEFPSSGSGTQLSFNAGSNLDIQVAVGAFGSLNSPSGTVTVSLGPMMQTVTLTPFAESFGSAGNSTATATFSNVPAGSYSLSASYAGDNNWNSATYAYPNTLTFATPTSAPIATSTTLTVSPSSISSNTSATLTAKVTASGMVAGVAGIVEFFANGARVAIGVISAVPGPGSSPGTTTVSVPGGLLPIGNVQLVAVFTGLGGFAASTSAPVSVTVTPTNFSMSIGASRLMIKSGQSGSVPLLLGGPNGGTVALSLICAPSSNQFACSVNPSSPSVNGSMSATLTINAFVPASTAANFVSRHNFRAGFFAASAGFVSFIGLVVALPGRKRKSGVLCGLALFAIAGIFVGCGGGSSVTPPPPPNNVNTPPGPYTVLVTGTSNGVVHNAKLTVIVQ